MRRLVAAVVAALALGGLLILAFGGSDDLAATERGYIEDANAIQARSGGAFAAADRAYVEFARGTLPVDSGADRLRRAEAAIRATRTRLAGLRPPDSARRLHAKLLRLYDLQIAMARETTELVTYPPRLERALSPLAGAQRKLGKGVRADRSPEQQAQAFEAYAASLGGIVREVSALRPPALLAPSHAGQVKRLRSARALALELRTAVRGRDQPAVARLLVRFRRVASRRPPGLPKAALSAYEGRYRAIAQAAGDVRREQARLQERLRRE